MPHQGRRRPGALTWLPGRQVEVLPLSALPWNDGPLAPGLACVCRHHRFSRSPGRAEEYKWIPPRMTPAVPGRNSLLGPVISRKWHRVRDTLNERFAQSGQLATSPRATLAFARQWREQSKEPRSNLQDPSATGAAESSRSNRVAATGARLLRKGKHRRKPQVPLTSPNVATAAEHRGHRSHRRGPL
jgi:hypothetical protein